MAVLYSVLRFAAVVAVAVISVRVTNFPSPGGARPNAAFQRWASIVLPLGALVSLLVGSAILKGAPTPRSMPGHVLAIGIYGLELAYAFQALATLWLLVIRAGIAFRLRYDRFWPDVVATHRLRRLSHPSRSILSSAPYLFLVAGVNVAAFRNMEWHGFAAFALFESAILVQGVVLRRLPPSVIYFAASCPETLAMQAALVSGNPYRIVISLLDSNTATGKDTHDIESLNFRTEAASQWEPIALVLANLAAVIVMDARYPSSLLKWEAARLASGKMLGKTLIVADSQAQVSDIGLQQQRTDPSPQYTLVAPAALETTLGKRLAVLIGEAHARWVHQQAQKAARGDSGRP